MKKVLICMSPLLLLIIAIVWCRQGFEEMLKLIFMFVIGVFLALGMFKWIMFVDKHFKD